MPDVDFSEIDFESDMAIDPSALDVEWIEQPVLFMKYSRMHTMAVRRAKRKSERVKTKRSELVKEARIRGEAKNAQDVEAYYRMHPVYKELKKECIDAEYEAEMLGCAIFALHQRKATLENMVRLLAAEYFAPPQGGRNITKEWEDRNATQRAVDIIKNRTTRTRKGRRN